MRKEHPRLSNSISRGFYFNIPHLVLSSPGLKQDWFPEDPPPAWWRIHHVSAAFPISSFPSRLFILFPLWVQAWSCLPTDPLLGSRLLFREVGAPIPSSLRTSHWFTFYPSLQFAPASHPSTSSYPIPKLPFGYFSIGSGLLGLQPFFPTNSIFPTASFPISSILLHSSFPLHPYFPTTSIFSYCLLLDLLHPTHRNQIKVCVTSYVAKQSPQKSANDHIQNIFRNSSCSLPNPSP